MTSTNGRRSADERVDAKDVEMETHEHEPNDDDDDEDVRRSVSEVKRQHGACVRKNERMECEGESTGEWRLG